MPVAGARVAASVVALLVAGCAGDAAPEPALGFADAPAGVAGLDPDGSGARPGSPDTRPDAPPAGDAPAGDVGPDPAACLAPGEVARLCDAGCAAVAACKVTVFGGAPCGSECPSAVATDPARAATLRCLELAAADGTCEAPERCLAETFAPPGTCRGACAALADCPVGPDALLGRGGCPCEVTCEALTRLAPGAVAPVSACILDELAGGCTDAAGTLCLGALDRTVACGAICDALKDCGAIPGLYQSLPACRGACTAWSPGELVAAQACADRLGEHPTGCYDPGDCIPPPEAIAPGAQAWCAAVSGACGGLEAVGLPAQIDVCAWILTGSTGVWPGVDWAAATACAEGLASCGDPDEILGCVSAWPGCQPYCQRLDACELLGDDTDLDACAEGCRFAHLVQPGPVAQVTGCVAGAGSDCDAVAICQTGVSR